MSQTPLADIGVIGVENVGHPRTNGYPCVCPECVAKRKAILALGDALLGVRPKIPDDAVWQDLFSKANLAIVALLSHQENKW